MTKYKDKKTSMVEFTRMYANNDQTCEEFFIRANYYNDFSCEKCGCNHCRRIFTHNHVCTLF